MAPYDRAVVRFSNRGGGKEIDCMFTLLSSFKTPPLFPGGRFKAPSANPCNDSSDYAILCAVPFHTLQSRHKAVQNFVDNVKLKAKNLILIVGSISGTSVPDYRSLHQVLTCFVAFLGDFFYIEMRPKYEKIILLSISRNSSI